MKNAFQNSEVAHPVNDNKVFVRENFSPELNGATAFHMACRNGQLMTAKFLLETSVELNMNMNSKDRNGYTAFHLACFYNHSKIVELLVQKSIQFSIDLNAQDQIGRTAFHLVCKYGPSKIAEFLKDKSTEFNIDLNLKKKTYLLRKRTLKLLP